MTFKGLFVLIVLAIVYHDVSGHGYMEQPPARNCLWRFRNLPEDKHNYNDMQLWCGGLSNLWDKNGGKCGICGDDYSGPKDHETGGRFFTKMIAGKYSQGQDIPVKVK